MGFCFVLGLEWGFLSFCLLLAMYSNLAGLIRVCICECLNWDILDFNRRMEKL